MLKLMLSLAGVFAFVFGAGRLLFLMPGAVIAHPQVRQFDQALILLSRLFAAENASASLIGVALIALGVIANICAFLPPADRLSLPPRQRRLICLALVVSGTLASLFLLLAVTYLNLRWAQGDPVGTRSPLTIWATSRAP